MKNTRIRGAHIKTDAGRGLRMINHRCGPQKNIHLPVRGLADASLGHRERRPPSPALPPPARDSAQQLPTPSSPPQWSGELRGCSGRAFELLSRAWRVIWCPGRRAHGLCRQQGGRIVRFCFVPPPQPGVSGVWCLLRIITATRSDSTTPPHPPPPTPRPPSLRPPPEKP